MPPLQMRLKDIMVKFEGNNLSWDYLDIPKQMLYHTTSKIRLCPVIPNMSSDISISYKHALFMQVFFLI